MLNVLVIDDDRIDREAIKRHIMHAHRDISFYEAHAGKDAYDILCNKKFDMVFLDYHLPDMDGISLLRQLYDHETDLVTSPIVMLTGQGNEAVMADALRWGAQDYLVKNNMTRDTLLIAMTKAREMFDLKVNRRQAEEQIRQIQKMDAVGLLTSGIAHDFNNLLTVILGNTRLIRKRLADKQSAESADDIGKKIEAIDKAACKGADLVKRLMIFTRQSPLQDEIVDVNTTIRDTCHLIRNALNQSIEVKLDLCDDFSSVHVDPGQFENALINISMNARDAMPAGGKLVIETKSAVLDDAYALSYPDVKPGHYMMIAISDTGTGIPPDVMKRIFDPFFTTKPAGEGTGLGLSMVYGFIRQSGGHVQVYSEIGHGSTFKIYLPCTLSKDGALTAAHKQDAALQGHETILIVEDDASISNVAIAILRQLGYRVLHAQNSESALRALQANKGKVDLVLVDIFLQNTMSGLDFVDDMRNIYPFIKVIYTSGFMASIVDDYSPINGRNFLSKPYSREQLAGKIRQVLDDADAIEETKERVVKREGKIIRSGH